MKIILHLTEYKRYQKKLHQCNNKYREKQTCVSHALLKVRQNKDKPTRNENLPTFKVMTLIRRAVLSIMSIIIIIIIIIYVSLLYVFSQLPPQC